MIVILDDEPLTGLLFQDFLETLDIPSHRFDNDRRAFEFIYENASSVTGIVQDIERMGTSQQLPQAIFGSRKRLGDPLGPLLDGGAFYLDVIDLRLPWTNVAFVSADTSNRRESDATATLRRGGGDPLMAMGDSILKEWARRDPRITASTKPITLDKLETIVAHWALPTGDQRSCAVRLLEPANEEFAFAFASQPDLMHSMDPRRFEEFVSFVLENHGFRTELTAATRDGGYDIRAVHPDRSNEVVLVEVKRYALRRKVEVGVVRSLFGTKYIQGAAKVMLVTSSFASPDALREFARTIPHEFSVMDHTNLVTFCRGYAAHLLEASDPAL